MQKYCLFDGCKNGINFHLAAKFKPGQSYVENRDLLDSNVLGTYNVLDFAKSKNVKVIFASSAAVYGPNSGVVSESSPINIKHLYAESKFLAEDLCRFYSSNYKVNCLVLRLFNVYGGKQKDSFLIHLQLSE